jgi:prepilin-type N-terminal cleavage/methylation domain-containing protein
MCGRRRVGCTGMCEENKERSIGFAISHELSAMSPGRGFTLIELAVVIVIIGILIGVVLKAATMIENARIKAVVNQANELATAVYSYQDKFSKLPGDDSLATNRWTTTNGNNNGRIDVAEPFLANQHLALAGFISGTYDGTSQAIRVAKYTSNVYIMSAFGATGFPGGAAPFLNLQALCSNVINFTTLPAEVVQVFDLTLDDGVWNTGKVQASAAYTPNTTIANTAICL